MNTKTKDFFRDCFYAFIERRPPTRWKTGEYCCEELKSRVTDQCDWALRMHPYGQCPDQVIVERADGFLLPIQDGGGSGIQISYCPWCAQTLPQHGFGERD